MLPTGAAGGTPIDRSACPSTRGHGTRWYRQRYGCTCADAKAHARRVRREQYRRDALHLPCDVVTCPAIGTARTLQACAVIGYGTGDLAAELGMTSTRVRQLRSAQYPTVRHETRDRVTRLARRLHERRTHPVDDERRTGYAHTRARDHAARMGWLPFGAWDDIQDPDERPDPAWLRAAQPAVVATEDLLELAAETAAAVDDHGRRVPDPAPIAARVGLPVEEVARRLRFARTGAPATPPDVVDAIRAEYRACPPGEFVRAHCAARHGTKADAVDRALRGTVRDGYPDLIAELGRKHQADLTRRRSDRDRPLHGPVPVAPDVVDAIRADYAAGGVGTHRLADRYGTTQPTVLRIVHGTARPHLALTDLTAQPRGHHQKGDAA